VSVIWHDLECGGYSKDLAFWRALAEEHGGPVLDVGAGTGRVALELARARFAVTALDLDDELLAELRARAGNLDVRTVVGDARAFDLGERFALCIVPMQTIQLLGGREQRAAFLGCAREHLDPGGVLAIALADALEVFDVTDGASAPLPDVCELEGVLYSSRPTAVRADEDGFLLERTRETVTADGRLLSQPDRIHLDRLHASQLEREAVAAGLKPAGRAVIPATSDHVGSDVVMLGA